MRVALDIHEISKDVSVAILARIACKGWNAKHLVGFVGSKTPFAVVIRTGAQTSAFTLDGKDETLQDFQHDHPKVAIELREAGFVLSA